MKVLFILDKDVYNIPAAKIAEEMLKRGYDIDFYASYLDVIHIRMFGTLHVSILPISELSMDELDQYDFIYSAMTLDWMQSFWNVQKYVFHFTTAPFDEPIGYGDFTFTQRDMKIRFQDALFQDMEKIKEIKSYPGKVTGNPKYDSTESDDGEEKDKKQILFVDAGHFPYTKEGKMEEAKMLLAIAKRFPEYQLVIKPRFLPHDQNVTHRNEVHLYNCLQELSGGRMPSNIECLQRHVDLEEKARKSMIIITPEMTSTYLDIGVYGKRGLVVTDLPNDEGSVVGNAGHRKRMRKIVQRSGVCIPYTDILHYLPEGKQFSNEHLREMGLLNRNASENIVDTIEWIYSHFILHNRYPSADSVADDQKALTIEEVISLRYFKSLFSVFEITKCRIEELDFTEAENYIYRLWESKVQMNQDNYPKYRDTAVAMVRNTILGSKDILMENAMKQSYYLQTLYEAGKMQLEKEEDYLAKGMFWCLMGKYEIITNNNAERALYYFQKYFDETAGNLYEKTLADMQYYKESAVYWSGVCCYKMGNLQEAERFFEHLEVMTDNGHKKAKEYLERIRKVTQNMN